MRKFRSIRRLRENTDLDLAIRIIKGLTHNNVRVMYKTNGMNINFEGKVREVVEGKGSIYIEFGGQFNDIDIEKNVISSVIVMSNSVSFETRNSSVRISWK